MYFTTEPADRSAFIGALLELASYLGSHPAVPVPLYSEYHTLHADSIEDGGKSQVDHIARLLDVTAYTTSGGHYLAVREFGQISYQAVSIPADPSDRTSMERLTRIGELITPCPPPDMAAGIDLCPCGTGQTWPCARTMAAWLAAGENPDTQIRLACQACSQQMAAEHAEWQATIHPDEP